MGAGPPVAEWAWDSPPKAESADTMDLLVGPPVAGSPGYKLVEATLLLAGSLLANFTGSEQAWVISLLVILPTAFFREIAYFLIALLAAGLWVAESLLNIHLDAHFYCKQAL